MASLNLCQQPFLLFLVFVFFVNNVGAWKNNTTTAAVPYLSQQQLEDFVAAEIKAEEEEEGNSAASVVAIEGNDREQGSSSISNSGGGGGVKGWVGDDCNLQNDCLEGLKCVRIPRLSLRNRKRCIPDISCISRAVVVQQQDSSSMNAGEWSNDQVLLEQKAGKNNMTLNDLVQAARESNGLDDFQSQPTMQQFITAFRNSNNTAIRPSAAVAAMQQQLQNSVEQCLPKNPQQSQSRQGSSNNNNLRSGGGTRRNGFFHREREQSSAEKAPTTTGTTSYMGLHIEVGFLVDIAMSIFGTIDDTDDPNSWIRGTYGGELGIPGAELSWLIGFAFTGTSEDIAGNAVAVDADVGLAVGAGAALIFHSNGLVSLEFTLGPQIGAGLGVAYSCTVALDDDEDVPTSAPTGPTTSSSSFNSATQKFSCTNTESELQSMGVAAVSVGTSNIYIGTRQVSSINQNPILVRFDSSGNQEWCREDYEESSVDGTGLGLVYGTGSDGDRLYAAFTVDGTNGASDMDFRRFTTDGWISSYGMGGGPKVSVVLQINPDTGEGIRGSFIIAQRMDGNTNTLVVNDMSYNDDQILVQAESFFFPLKADKTRMTVETDCESTSSPFAYEATFDADLTQVLATKCNGLDVA